MKNNNQILNFDEFINSLVGEINAENEELKKEKTNDKLTEVLKEAYRIREFELDLYWKRAGYFWALIVATFAAYFNVTNKYHYQFLVICIGVVFSFAWYLVNRGSTYWVTNYERLIDAIEQKKKISFYNLNLEKEYKWYILEHYFPFSVSRINNKISFFIFLIWLFAFIRFLLKSINIDWANIFLQIDYPVLFLAILTMATFVWLCVSKSNNVNKFAFKRRDSKYKNDSQL